MTRRLQMWLRRKRDYWADWRHGSAGFHADTISARVALRNYNRPHTDTVAAGRTYNVCLCSQGDLRKRKFAAESYRAWCRLDGKTIVLAAGSYTGVNPARFAPTVEAMGRAEHIRKEMGIPRGAPVVGFVGRLTKDKGTSELVEAYLTLRTEIPELKLLLVGEMEEGDPLPAHIRHQINCDHGIFRTGFVQDPSSYYHVMDVFAFPTIARASVTWRSKRMPREDRSLPLGLRVQWMPCSMV